MQELNIIHTKDIPALLDTYPKEVQNKLLQLRTLIFKSAKELGIKNIEETLKWGEPSYLTKNGSTLRMDWKPKTPNQYALYFKCTSKLIPTIKSIFGNIFKYENNRAIIFNLPEELPTKEIKACIKMALAYHTLKQLPDLGYTNKK